MTPQQLPRQHAQDLDTPLFVLTLLHHFLLQRRFAILIFSVICFSSCDDAESDTRAYPRVETSGTAIVSGGVKLYGKILTPGTAEISDHGFTWTSSGFPNIRTSPKLSLGKMTTTGQFNTTITSGLEKNKSYTVRAYAVTSGYEVYGQDITFIYR